MLKFSKSGNHRPQVKKLTVLGNERLTAGGERQARQARADQRQEAAQRTESGRRRVSAPGQRQHQQAP